MSSFLQVAEAIGPTPGSSGFDLTTSVKRFGTDAPDD
jgi:hypothetical protein